MQISGIAFDNDGVLVDTEPIQWKGWVHVLKPFNVNFTKEDYIVYGLGHTTEHIANYLIQRFNLPIESHVLAEQKEKTVVEWFQTAPLNVMPFAIETLHAFHEQKFPLALVSSAPTDEIMIKVKRMGVEALFGTIVSRSDVKEGKPFPDMYLLAAKRLGFSPKEMVAFEDTPSGVASAHAAGMVSVAIPNDFSKTKQFPHADAILPDLSHALPFVKKLQQEQAQKP